MTARLPVPDRVCTREALRRIGFADTEIRSAAACGELFRLARDLYAPTAWFVKQSPSEQFRIRIRAEAERAPGMVISHTSAAAWHHLPLVGSDPAIVHLTRIGSGGGRRFVDRTVHVANLPGGCHLVVDGVDVTSVARTLIDLGRTESLATTVVAGDAALRRKIVTLPELQQELATALAHKGYPGACRSLAAMDSRSESPGESLLRLALIGAGLPAPELQVVILDEEGEFVARVDAAYLAFGILLEFDGHTKYGALLRPGQSVTDVVLAEKRREERLTALGWHVIRVIWAELRNPAELVHRVTTAIRARRRFVAGIRGTARSKV